MSHQTFTRRVLPGLLSTVICVATAAGQTLNIDLGNGPAGNDGDYIGVAASGQGGRWNYINDPMLAGVEVPLVGTDGIDTGVTFVSLIDTQTFDAVEPTPNLLDSDLLGDFHWENPGTDGSYEIRNLEPGQYNLFVYAYAGDVVNDDTIVTYNGEAQTVAHVGIGDPFSHEFLDTFALYFPVEPDVDGTVAFTVAAGPGIPGVANFWQVNGLQLGVGDPSRLPPQVVITEPFRGVDENGCCTFEWTLRNSNPVAAVDRWHMEIEAGMGGRLVACTGPDSVTVQPDWHATFCYPWDMGTGVSAPSSRAVVTLTGPPLAPGQTISGTMSIEVNGEPIFTQPGPPPVTLPYDPPGDHIVPSAGFHVHVNQGPPDAPCDTGEYNAHNGLSDSWGGSIDTVCLPAFFPVPSFTATGKGVLLTAVGLCGIALVRRSRRNPAGLIPHT